jgi:hypothetical protein
MRSQEGRDKFKSSSVCAMNQTTELLIDQSKRIFQSNYIRSSSRGRKVGIINVFGVFGGDRSPFVVLLCLLSLLFCCDRTFSCTAASRQIPAKRHSRLSIFVYAPFLRQHPGAPACLSGPAKTTANYGCANLVRVSHSFSTTSKKIQSNKSDLGIATMMTIRWKTIVSILACFFLPTVYAQDTIESFLQVRSNMSTSNYSQNETENSHTRRPVRMMLSTRCAPP